MFPEEHDFDNDDPHVEAYNKICPEDDWDWDDNDWDDDWDDDDDDDDFEFEEVH